MRDSRYIFRAEDIRECFPQVSDATISKWLQRGFVDNAVSQKAVRQSYKYSALQVVHVGVLSQLSAWGVLSYYRDAIIYCPVMGQYTLTEPAKWIESYYALGPDVVLLTKLHEFDVEQPDKRQRQTKTVPHIYFMQSEDFHQWHEGTVQGMTIRNTNAFVGPDGETITDLAQRFRYSYLFMDVGTIIKDVYSTLNMTHLLG